MIDTTKGLLSTCDPECLEALWDFAGIEDKDMWTKDTPIELVVSYITRNILNDMEDNTGITIKGDKNYEISYARCYMMDVDPEPFCLDWIFKMKHGRKLVKALIGHLIDKGFCDYSCYGARDWLMELADEKSEDENKEEKESAKDILWSIKAEDRLIESCKQSAHDMDIDSIKKSYQKLYKKIEPVFRQWIDCAIDIVRYANDLLYLSSEGIEFLDSNGDGDSAMDTNFFITFDNGYIYDELHNICESGVNEVGYSPGMELSDGKNFNDYNELYERLKEFNYDCISYKGPQ